MPLPQFFVLGAPKAGTTALHAALATHPQLFLSPVKEPKFYLCDGVRPARSGGRGQRGPGDAHSAREWVWQRDRYEALFDGAPADALRGESTPFYLHDLAAQTRIARDVPDARLVAIVRDPVDRAYSNWTHLWSDGYEPLGNFAAAVDAEPARIADGWAPFWHYLALGRFGMQLANLFTLFEREQVLVLRYRELVAEPERTLDRVAAHLGVTPGLARAVPPENVKAFAPANPVNTALRAGVRAGSALGAYAPPQVWRTVEAPLRRALQRGGAKRPPLDVDVRRSVLARVDADISLLEDLLGESFADWRRDRGRGEFRARGLGDASGSRFSASTDAATDSARVS